LHINKRMIKTKSLPEKISWLRSLWPARLTSPSDANFPTCQNVPSSNQQLESCPVQNPYREPCLPALAAFQSQMRCVYVPSSFLLLIYVTSILERSSEGGISGQHCRLLDRMYCGISCPSFWCRLVPLPCSARSVLFPRCLYASVPTWYKTQEKSLVYKTPYNRYSC
jgi:hypothetical protein